MSDDATKPIIPDDGRMKPILLIPPDLIDGEGVKALRDNGLCVVVAKDPGAVKFLDPIPAMRGRTKVEDAAIALSRKILNPQTFARSGVWVSLDRKEIASLYVELLVKGTPLDPAPSAAEVERQAYDQSRLEEVRKIAREEAREEAAARREERKVKKAAGAGK